MSWYTILGHQPDLLVAVGWSGLLRTYFATIERVPDTPAPDTDDLLLCIGTTPGEIACPDQLAARLAPYATLDAAMRAQLLADRAAPSPHGPSAEGQPMSRRAANDAPD